MIQVEAAVGAPRWTGANLELDFQSSAALFAARRIHAHPWVFRAGLAPFSTGAVASFGRLWSPTYILYLTEYFGKRILGGPDAGFLGEGQIFKICDFFS